MISFPKPLVFLAEIKWSVIPWACYLANFATLLHLKYPSTKLYFVPYLKCFETVELY